MLERIETIQGIGLLHDVNGSAIKLNKSTLIYADNGRGKSTLATILRSVSLNDPKLIHDRKTIDGTFPPMVTLQFPSGHKVSFSGRQWSEARPEFVVYDAEFVEKNVHSGGVVTTGHRKNLLQFALGEKAVAARKSEEQATEDARIASELVQQIIKQLSGYHEGVRFDDFEKMSNVIDAHKQIESLEKRIVAARSSALLLKRSVPSAIPIPNIELSQLFEVLLTTIESVQNNAEAIVREHVATLGKSGIEAWLSQGQDFDQGKKCPYCSQSTAGIDLIKAYKTHFNAEYAALKAKVSALDRIIYGVISESVVKNFAQQVSNSAAAANAWSDQIGILDIRFDIDAAQGLFEKLRDSLLALALKKQINPTVSAGTTAEHEVITGLWKDVVGLMDLSNTSISLAKIAIDDFRKTLAAEDLQKLSIQQKTIVLSQKRHEATVVSLMANLAAARLSSVSAEKAKDNSRSVLDALMKQTLKDYQKSINDLLMKFGASFQIKSMDANFRGGSPRSEYGLELRGKSVPLEGGPPSFGTALSEGDKRTLAFAFFVATTLSDPGISTRIIVIDDPMCSLDLNRKHHTRSVLKDLNGKSKQIIILAHDIYFLRDLRKDLIKQVGANTVSAFGLRHANMGYTQFSSLDIDKECQSPYFQHHSLLLEYVKCGNGDQRYVSDQLPIKL